MKKIYLPIQKFEGQFQFLSNFYHSEIKYENIVYPTVEHAYQAAKSSNPEIRQQVALYASPGQAKRAGRTLRMRQDFERKKLDIMLDLLRLKFEDPLLGTWLIDTGDALLVEGNEWGDTYWGEYMGKGDNHLGKLLMQVREELNGKA